MGEAGFLDLPMEMWLDEEVLRLVRCDGVEVEASGSVDLVEENVRKHWAYTCELLRLASMPDWVLKLCEYLYVEAMRHGYKHGLQRSWEP